MQKPRRNWNKNFFVHFHFSLLIIEYQVIRYKFNAFIEYIKNRNVIQYNMYIMNIYETAFTSFSIYASLQNKISPFRPHSQPWILSEFEKVFNFTWKWQKRRTGMQRKNFFFLSGVIKLIIIHPLDDVHTVISFSFTLSRARSHTNTVTQITSQHDWLWVWREKNMNKKFFHCIYLHINIFFPFFYHDHRHRHQRLCVLRHYNFSLYHFLTMLICSCSLMYGNVYCYIHYLFSTAFSFFSSSIHFHCRGCCCCFLKRSRSTCMYI